MNLNGFWYTFLAIGALFFTGASWNMFQTWESQRLVRHARGTVTRIWAGDKLGVEFQAEVQFPAENGRPRQFSFPIGSKSALRNGQAVTVVYDVDAPEQAHIELRAPELWTSAIILDVWAGCFLLLGGIPVLWGVRKRRRNEWLKVNGQMVQAQFRGVQEDKTFSVNEKHPFRIHAQWTDPVKNLPYRFQSDYLWIDPSAHLKTVDVIAVIIDPKNPERYWMDLAFLPK